MCLENPDGADLADFATNFNWEDVHGYDFTPPVKDQKGCGSCYDVASNSMLESRIKIWFGKETHLSSQFTLQCNFMTEGCKGGWGIFRGFFLESFYTVDESCAPYLASTKDDGCQNYRDCEPRAKVAETYYVGGHYGAMSEEKIMRELRCNGPILFDFRAGGAFQIYKNGILDEVAPETLQMLSK